MPRAANREYREHKSKNCPFSQPIHALPHLRAEKNCMNDSVGRQSLQKEFKQPEPDILALNWRAQHFPFRRQTDNPDHRSDTGSDAKYSRAMTFGLDGVHICILTLRGLNCYPRHGEFCQSELCSARVEDASAGEIYRCLSDPSF